MKQFPSCFSENGVQIADSSCSNPSAMTVSKTKPSQNSVTSLYQCKLLNKSRLIIIKWTNNLTGHCFSIQIENLHIKPSIFSKRKGSRSVHVDCVTIDVNWDLTDAKFGSSPEPITGFLVCLVLNGEMVVSIGDLRKETLSKTMLLSKTEHVLGRKHYGTKAQFTDDGRIHDVEIECDALGVDDDEDHVLVVRLDGKIVMEVKHLVWKFRGNKTITVDDGVGVEVFWDVHNWLFGSVTGSAVFMFQTCSVDDGRSGDVWSCLQSSGFCLRVYAWKNK